MAHCETGTEYCVAAAYSDPQICLFKSDQIVGPVAHHDIRYSIRVVHHVMVHWMRAFVGVHVATDHDVDVVFIEQRFDGRLHVDGHRLPKIADGCGAIDRRRMLL